MYRRPPEGASASLLSVGWPLDLGAKQEVAELLQCGAFSIAGYRAAISVHSYMIILLTGIVKEKGKRRNTLSRGRAAASQSSPSRSSSRSRLSMASMIKTAVSLLFTDVKAFGQGMSTLPISIQAWASLFPFPQFIVGTASLVLKGPGSLGAMFFYARVQSFIVAGHAISKVCSTVTLCM